MSKCQERLRRALIGGYLCVAFAGLFMPLLTGWGVGVPTGVFFVAFGLVAASGVASNVPKWRP